MLKNEKKAKLLQMGFFALDFVTKLIPK